MSLPANIWSCTFLKRLTFGFTVSTVPYQISVAMSLRYDYHPHDVKFCQADGFLFQYLAAVGLLFTAGISLVLFFKVWEIANPWKPAFVEALNLKKTKACSINEAGLWEQIWLWNVPYGFVALLTILLFVASFCLLGRGLTNSKFQKLVEVGFFDSLISLAVLSVAFILETICGYYFSFQDHNYAVWASYWLYLSDPLNSTFIPITLLFAIHLPLSSVIVHICCKYQRQNLIHTQRTFDQVTFRSSTWIQQPSHTTWDPPHSSNEDSEIVPFARHQQQQEYGNLN